jgi:hypothetical protein
MTNLNDESQNIHASGFILGSPLQNFEVLPAGETVQLSCERLAQTSPTMHAEIAITIHYRPSFWFGTKGRAYPFEAERTDEGTWVWKGLPSKVIE